MIAATTIAATGAARAAQSSPPKYGTIANSAKGLIGCLSAGAFRQPKFTIYCLAMQVPSSGAEVGRLTTDAWTCRYSDNSQFVSAAHAVLSPSALKVSPDGSFTFSAHLPGIGQVSVVGAGNGVHDAHAAPYTRLIGPPGDGYRPQGYTLVSPKSGLTTYGLDPPYALGPFALDPNPASYALTPELMFASVNGQRQDRLIGTIWRAPTSGEWDFDSC